MRLETARNQNHLRYPAGLALRFGGESPKPPAPRPPATKVCRDGKTVLASEACPKLDLKLAWSNPAAADFAIAVREYLAPTGTAQAHPGEVYVGSRAALTSRFQGQGGGTIQPPACTASEGAVADDELDSSNVRFNAFVHSEQREAVPRTAIAADNGGTCSATTTVTLVRKAADASSWNSSAAISNAMPAGKAALVGGGDGNQQTRTPY